MSKTNGHKPNLSNMPKSVKLPKAGGGGGKKGCAVVLFLAAASLAPAGGALGWWLS